MNADDARHGSWAGYQRGCRLDCCTTAARNYQKARVLDLHRGNARKVSVVASRRRIEALACLGWSGHDVARRLGRSNEWIRQVLMREQIHRTTAERIAAIYDELSMTLPATDTHPRRAMVSRTKKRAHRMGWLPPLAWDDIDDPSETPNLDALDDDTSDPVVVERILAGDWRLKATAAERLEVIARWTRSANELERLTGWNVRRDARQEAA